MGEGRTLSFSLSFQCFNFTAKKKQKHGRSICKFNCEIINSTGFLSSLLPSCERIPRSCVGSNHQSRTESGYSGFNWPECDHHILYNEFSLQHCVSSFTLESISVWFLIHDGSHQHHCVLSLQSHGQFSAFLCLLRHPYKVLEPSSPRPQSKLTPGWELLAWCTKPWPNIALDCQREGLPVGCNL